jgi:hypothetical protein
MSVKVYVDAQEVKLKLTELPPKALDAAEGAANELEQELLSRAQGLASGAVLQVRSGKYLAAIKGDVSRTTETVKGRVYSRDPRVDLFEYGGSTGPHDIEASNAQALVLQVRGGTIFRKSVHHPGGDYGRSALGAGSRGKYSVLFTALDAMRAEIFEKMYHAVDDAVGID